MPHIAFDQTNPLFNGESRDAFLRKTGWTITDTVGKDTSIRRYFRVTKGRRTAILMESVPDQSPAMTRGHLMTDFITIAQWLSAHGLRAPEIYEANPDAGYMLLEDLGNMNFRQAMDCGHDVRELYMMGADLLAHIQDLSDIPADLPDYKDSHIRQNHKYVMEYYLPCALGEAKVQGANAAFSAAWDVVEQSLPPCPQGFIHVDFHAENLMLLDGGTGLGRCGILDFQGAKKGPLPYDLVNLLKDARIDVPDDVRQEILARYDEDFLAWYRVLGVQFHCRVIGQFIKIATENDAPRYLRHIPRLENYIAQALDDPLMKPLKTFFDDLSLDFCAAKDLNEAELERFIRIHQN